MFRPPVSFSGAISNCLKNRSFLSVGFLLPAQNYQSISYSPNLMDTEYIILENIYDSAEQEIPLRQRELAQIAGASLGMTNSILKRLAQKGWITIKKLNSRNIQYAVTLEGINEIVHRSYRYFKRTIKNVVYFKDILEEVVYRAGRNNFSTVALVGKSDLDFIVEHASRRWGLSFVRIPADEKAREKLPPKTLKIYAENIPDKTARGSLSGISSGIGAGRFSGQDSFYLSRLIMKQAAGTEKAINDD